MNIKLSIKQQFIPHEPEVHELVLSGKSVYSIGREACDVILKVAKVSRQHAELFLGPQGQLGFRDLGSTNGTRVRGEPTDATWLHTGDEIAIKTARIQIIYFYLEDAEKKKLAG